MTAIEAIKELQQATRKALDLVEHLQKLNEKLVKDLENQE